MPSAQFQHGTSQKPSRQPVHRRLHMLAGFYRDKAGAESALLTLTAELGVAAGQITLLSPSDASRMVFTWKSRHWTGARGLESDQTQSSPLLAVIGGLVVVVAALILLMMLLDIDLLANHGMRRRTVLMLTAGVLFTAALAAWVLLTLRARGRRVRRFASTVRQELAAGRWGLIVHGFPPGSQAPVLTLLQEGGVGWTAASQAPQAL